MKHSKGVLLLVLLAILLAGAASPLTAKVSAADESVTIAVFNPTGASEVTQVFAPRLPDLNGKTICQLSLGIWEANRTFPVIGDLLQKQFGAKSVPYNQLPALSETKDVPGLEEAVKKAGCHGVIVGNAG